MTVTEEPSMKATIYHNPSCGTSRNTLALIRHAGIEPEVIEYLATPPTRERLAALIAARPGVRDALPKGNAYSSSDWRCIPAGRPPVDAMLPHPA